MLNSTHIRTSLERQAEALRSAITSLHVSDGVLDQEAANRLLQHNSRLLHRVLSAIEAIDNGQYGLCAVCGQRIPYRRLTAVPWATRCTHCAVSREHSAAA